MNVALNSCLSFFTHHYEMVSVLRQICKIRTSATVAKLAKVRKW